MGRIHRCLDVAALVLMLGAPVIIWLTGGDAGWHGDDGRRSLALRLAWGISVLAAALRMPALSLTRRLGDRRESRRWESKKATLRAALDRVSRSESGRGGRSSSREPRLTRPAPDQAARPEGAGLGGSPGHVPSVAVADSRSPIDIPLAVPRDFVAGVGGPPRGEAFMALTIEVGIVPMGCPADPSVSDAVGQVERLVAYLPGITRVIDGESGGGLEVAAAEMLPSVGTRNGAVPPHPPLEEVVAPPFVELQDMIGRAALGLVPARQQPGLPALVGRDHGPPGLALHVAGRPDDASDQGDGPDFRR